LEYPYYWDTNLFVTQCSTGWGWPPFHKPARFTQPFWPSSRACQTDRQTELP